MASNENVINNLKYLGLDLENIPDRIKKFKELDYRPSKFNNENIYKVYKYVNINDIQILFTKTNRLNETLEKYGKAVPLYAYLDSKTEENLERHTKFLNMVSKLDISKIEELENEQKMLNIKIPFKVKYHNDYLWQIYYSEITKQYFMLVTTEDLEYSAFFYLLKKQLENKNEKIFVPITHLDYSREYLGRIQISDTENYLWLFTKNWPLVYEVYDKNENMNLYLTGKTYIYDDLQSDYRIILKDKEESIKFYKLLKALFIMKTEMAHHYNFKLYINENGGLQFNIDDKKVIYEILPSIIKEEYLKEEEKKLNLMEEKMSLEKELDFLQRKSINLEKEYLDKEKEITIFLECRKTFLGRVKYFFKYKKVKLNSKNNEEEKKQEIKVIRLNKYGEIKKNYTIEELIELCKQLDKEEIKVKNLRLDIKAIKQRIETLENKVKNAKQYMQEIDEHKKSIFEFWKFTNKDKQDELPEGTELSISKENLKKTFDYELDFEDFGIVIDKKQRELLSKQEIESIYLTTTSILEDINKVVDNKEITEERLEYLKQNANEENNLNDNESFNIFGGISYDNKLQTLANKKHRETPRAVFRILDITKSTTVDEFVESIKQIINNLNSAFAKINLSISLPVYMCNKNQNLEKNYNIFSIRATQEINNIFSEDKTNIHKIILKETSNVLATSNIIYYDNINKTLPLGINIKEGVVLNLKDLDLNLISENKINMVYYKDEDNELSDVEIKTINVKEYLVN